jgi:hypothetical protein
MKFDIITISRVIAAAVYIQVIWAFLPLVTVVTYTWFSVQWAIGISALLYGVTRGRTGLAGAWIIFLVLQAFFGFYKGNYRSFVLLDISYLAVLTLAFVDLKREEFDRLLDCLLSHLANALLVAIPLVLATLAYLDFRPGTIESRYQMNMDKAGVDTFLLTGSIQFAMYFLPFFLRVRGWRKYSFPVAVLVYALYAMLTGSRTAMVTALASLVVSMFLIRDEARARGLFKEFRICCILIGAIVVLAVGMLGRSGLNDTIELQNERFGVNEDYTSGRYEEVVETYSELSLVEKLIGRGFGAGKQNLGGVQTEHGVHMVHFGPLHLVFKGGWIFFILLYGSIAVAALRVVRSGILRGKLLLMLLIFVGNDLTHQQWQSTFPLVALSLVLIASRISPQRERANFSLSRVQKLAAASPLRS